MSERTHIKQQIIDIMDNHFPESGFPDQIIFNEKYIIIISRMCDDSIEYKHKDYREDNFKNINLFSKADLNFIANIKMKYWSYNAVFFNDLIFFSSGVYGDYLRGELICYDIKNNLTIKCSDESRPVHWLALKDNLMEVYTFKSTGYYESDKEMFHVINPSTDLFFEWNKESFVPFSEDDLEDLLNEDSLDKRLNTLNFLIS